MSSTLPPETLAVRTTACSCSGGDASPDRTKLAYNFPLAVYNAVTRTVGRTDKAFTFRSATLWSPDTRADAVEVARMVAWVSRSATQESRYTLRS
jgi:hypothetical protein